MLDGFNTIYRKDRNCFGGGIMIYLSDLLRAIRRPEFETTCNESIWIEIESHTYSYFLCCVYRPPNSDGNFWTSLSWSIEKVGEITDNIIIIGDLNVDLLSIPQTHVIHDIMSNGNFVNNINEPTRVTNTSSTLIDLVLSTPAVKVHESGVLNIDSSVSDHKAIYISFSIDIELNRAYERNIWVYKDADFEKLNSLISNCDWDITINSAPNIDAAVAQFTSTFMAYVRECVPEKTITIRPRDKPWYDSMLRKTMRIRDRLRNKALRTNNDADWTKFRHVRNKVNNMKKHAITNYYDNIESALHDSSRNGKIYWKLMKDLFKVKATTEIPPLQFFENGQPTLAFSDIEKTETLNKYFSSISNIESANRSLPNLYYMCNNFFSDIHIEVQEVFDIISILPVNKAIGPDNISHRMLKYTKFSISKPLCMLFNKSLVENSFPNYWKIAHVLPLFKKDDPSVASNYRPVSLLSCVSKIMERIIFKHVYNFFHENNLFYKYQAGFLPGHSTVFQLLETYHSIVKSIEDGKMCCMIFCDLSKAFDRVWHEALIFKLQTYGISGHLLQWFKSYLSDRTQRVMYKNKLSSTLCINAGVPQGSVLGPLLFLIYINDVATNMLSFCRLYADDNSLQHCDLYTKNIEIVLNHDLKILSDWSDKWLLKFNPSKTKAVFFTKKHVEEFPKLFFQGCQLDYVSTHRHLGLLFSNDLSWSQYINNIVNSAYKK